MKHLNRSAFFILFLGITSTLFAQVPFTDVESKVASTDHIERLKEGVLLVRLNSNQKKMEQISISMQRTRNPSDSAKWAALLEDTMIETAEEHYAITDAIEAEYRFSEVAFFMDYDTRAILDRTKNPWTYDLKTEIQIYPSLPVYIMEYGRTPETSIKGYVILDANLDNIPRPFPNNVSASGFSALFGNDYTHIRKLNKKLFKYYHKIMTSADGI